MSLVHKNSGLLVDTYLTNEELVGRRSTPEEFRRELFRYRREGLLRLCSALNMLLFGWSPYIDKDLHDRLVGTFCTAALAAVENYPTRALFHRQGLLFVAKEAIRFGSDTGQALSAATDLTRLFTMANDQLVNPETSTDNTVSNSVRLIAQFLPISDLQFHRNVARLHRPYVMFSKLKELVPVNGKIFGRCPELSRN